MSPLMSAVTLVNEAGELITSLLPLITQHLSGGKEVTEEDVRQALAGKDAALKRLDEEIGRQGG